MREKEPQISEPSLEDTGELTKEKLLKLLKESTPENRKVVEKLMGDLKKYRHDGLTELRVGRVFYLNVDKYIKETIKKSNLNEFLETEKLDEKELEKLRALRLHIAYLDCSYLTMYNETLDHDAGDKLIKATANNIKSHIKSCYRLGGDEFAFHFQGTESDALKIMNDIKKNQADVDIPDIGLEPNIDLGKSHISEGIEAFLKAYSPEERRQMNIEKKTSEIQKLTTKIADLRCKIAKHLTRIKLFIELMRENKMGYLIDNLRYLEKGSGLDEITEEKLVKISTSVDLVLRHQGEEVFDSQCEEILREFGKKPKYVSKIDKVALEIAARKY